MQVYMISTFRSHPYMRNELTTGFQQFSLFFLSQSHCESDPCHTFSVFIRNHRLGLKCAKEESGMITMLAYKSELKSPLTGNVGSEEAMMAMWSLRSTESVPSGVPTGIWKIFTFLT